MTLGRVLGLLTCRRPLKDKSLCSRVSEDISPCNTVS